MSRDAVSLTEAEWKVMEELWDIGGATGRELTERMEKKMGWNRSTTLTLLRRLEGKKALEIRQEGAVRTFVPLLHRDDAALRETESFLGRVYHGSLSMMVSTLTRRKSLSQKEIDELYALLKDAEEKRNDCMD